ncbi:MAG: aldehyde ferredoxin oxidoreductase family protein [Anaerolineae bacterium]|nr:aldehyde ferredoxin oxidoreductase family protein [Anaerolineae bacterium]
MPYGYNGKILHVNLTDGTIEVEEPGETFYRRYMGGSALGIYYLLKQMPAGADPLGPENVLVLSLGPATGAAVSGQSRVTATAKSPLSGAIGDAQAGGFWPAEAKGAGFDAYVITGRSEAPLYLWVQDGQAELRDARHLWGKVTGEAEAQIRAELGDKRVEVLQVGPAGEKGVRYACLINMSNRANGRTGMGAVMGAKNLKAIAVRGHQRPEVADRQALAAVAKWGAQNFQDSNVYGMGIHGTADVLGAQNMAGGLPTRNWESGTFEGWEALTGERMTDTILQRRDTCYACVVRCKRAVETDWQGHHIDPHYGGPEYETLATFGSYCNVGDLAAISYANQLCNMYGLDTISCGATIAFAMDCFERGLLTLKDTGGVELRFGNTAAMVHMVEQIGQREGFGDWLAEGTARLADRLGPEARELAIVVKGHDLPAHMPEVKRSLGLIYAVNPFGADHQSSEHDPAYEDEYEYYEARLRQLDLLDPQEPGSLTPEKVRFALYTEQFYSMLDSVNVCQFVYGPAWHLYSPNQLVDMLNAVTGWDASLWELMKVGERRLNMMRAFNTREGFTREDDVLPPKLALPRRGGPSDGLTVPPEQIEQAKDLYYAMCGWDEAGVPTRAQLEKLGIGWVADELGR